MRCPRCGNENLDSNRFCGMCGATLLPAPEPVVSATAQGAAVRSSSSGSSTPTVPHTSEPRTSPGSEDSSFISGPSFLGLNDPAPRKRASLSTDPHGRSSSSLEYLLDDEEEHKGGGAGKFIVILLALALAVGFGYMRWKNHGLPWMSSSSNKPPAATQNPDSTDTTSTTAPAAATNSNPPATPSIQPLPDAAAANPPASPSGANPAVNSVPANSGTNSAAAPVSPDNAPATADAPPSTEAANPPETPAATAPAAADKEPATTADVPPAPKPRPSKAAAAPKPHAAVPAKAADPVTEARKYIYGRGAAQDCERGMRLLKPAANQSNAKAMVEMGALYSAGLCTPHDLPTAYRWFALALRKDPENQSVQADLQKLWGEMTQPERQLAIKLSQ